MKAVGPTGNQLNDIVEAFSEPVPQARPSHKNMTIHELASCSLSGSGRSAEHCRTRAMSDGSGDFQSRLATWYWY